MRSTPHCVMDDPRVGGDEVPERYSMAYFCNPNRETLIECLPTCTSEARPPAYPAVRAGDYLTERVAALVVVHVESEARLARIVGELVPV